jgi:hypothetical protein
MLKVVEDRTPLSKVKDFYYPIPARSLPRAEPNKKPGANLTPREWQTLSVESQAQYDDHFAARQHETIELKGAFLPAGACLHDPPPLSTACCVHSF